MNERCSVTSDFRYWECKWSYTFYYIDFTPLFAIIKRLKWNVFHCRLLNDIFDCDVGTCIVTSSSEINGFIFTWVKYQWLFHLKISELYIYFNVEWKLGFNVISMKNETLVFTSIQWRMKPWFYINSMKNETLVLHQFNEEWNLGFTSIQWRMKTWFKFNVNGLS